MRPVNGLGAPGSAASVDTKLNWLINKVQELCDASSEETEAIADAYVVANNVPATGTRALNAGTATASDVAHVLATLLQDMNRRGRTSG